MIIKRLVAENILKYRSLKLTDIPTTGQIAVAGNNEAGKTAIGETICFALFGRTFSLEPEEIARVIRWGEFRGQVVLEFTGSDGASFAIARQIDNNGKHTVRLHRAGEKEVLAVGVVPVENAIRKIAGFTYRSFVDSFYLAQREMEVPHAKSATVKALIGVDRLEAVATDLQEEAEALNQQIEAVDAELRAIHGQVAEIGLDRSRLGKLETQQETQLAGADVAATNAQQLANRAGAMAKAGKTLTQSCEAFVQSSLRNNYAQWRRREEHISAGLIAASKASKASGETLDEGPLKRAGAAVLSFESGLGDFERIRDLARLYHNRLTDLLEEKVSDARPTQPEKLIDDPGKARFADRRLATLHEIDRHQGRVKPYLGFGVFFLETALVGWVAWAVLLGMPESTLAGWLKPLIAFGDTGRQIACLLIALSGSASTAIMFAKYRKCKENLRLLDMELQNIEAACQTARDEKSIIEAIDEAALPDALSALKRLENPLIQSAATAFVEGDGAILVRSDALSEKLDEIRLNGETAIKHLRNASDRIERRIGEERKKATAFSEAAEAFSRQITTEKEQWDRVEALEHQAAGLESQRDRLLDDRRIRRLACELVEGACRRIYARFHPELRRFVSRILPELTQERYQHLELDDDLRVRVYCNEKNDFVGLAEISNGTHRQLMLCVRLALAQALIASSCNARQFIFFDEPFVFFDEHRMARAIDVLGKISPQITQIWLAAQTFSDPDRFDMMIDCNVSTDNLLASGAQRTAEPITS